MGVFHVVPIQVQSVNPTGDGAKSNVFSIVAAAKPDAPGRPVVDRRGFGGFVFF